MKMIFISILAAIGVLGTAAQIIGGITVEVEPVAVEFVEFEPMVIQATPHKKDKIKLDK